MVTATAFAEKKTMEFQAEVKQLLKIVINSLYTHKEIFLRELIANASDALDKLRILSLTDSAVLEDSSDLRIFIEVDSENRTLTISDNGIGMSYDEVIENIGTIAKSGTANFIERIKTDQTADANTDLIGRFGVGFYSAFMVAEKVTILTRPPKQDMGVKWESTGDGTYEIDQFEKGDRGTEIILKLKSVEDTGNNPDEDFLNQYTIQKHIQKHCNFVPYPIRMNFVTEQVEQDETGKVIEGTRQTVITEKTLNSIQPIWTKNPKEIEREQYIKFYEQQFHDWNEPAEIIHTRSDGTLEFTALLFIPSQAPYGLYTGEPPKGPQLYCRHMLVMNDCRELLPDYLKFVRGIVDSSDLPLNVSREVLQHNRHIQVIKNHLEKKILDSLRAVRNEDRKKYDSLWKEFGKAMKGGIFMDHKTTEKLQDLLIFESSHSPEEKTTLKEYVDRMPDGQKAIYFAAGESRTAIERLPQMEVFRDKGTEVLYFVDKIDEFLTQHLTEYAGKKLQSVSRGNLDLDEDRQDETQEKSEEQLKELLEFMRGALKDKVKDVRISKRLKTSPACLVSGDSGYSINMERLMREANQTMFRASRILEVNPDHGVIKTMDRILKENDDRTSLSDCCQLLYDQALLIENHKMEDPVRFANLVSDLIVRAYN
ncbi:MAG TPA: molecular chaperone HtpG [Blastocatellia bacterium]|nr:molecular chaperone HtpG [Blastocatellia bacterium]